MRAAPSYQELIENIDWNVAERELGYRPGDPINIAWMCSDRICRLGLANKLALLWEDYQGNEKRFTYDDVRILSNTIAQFLCAQGIRPGDRVCLFLDRVPELYFGFLGILKMGAVAQPLFSAFGDESLLVRLADAGTSAILTQKKHLYKVRKIRDQLPNLRHIILIDKDVRSLREREIAFAMEEAPRVEHVAGAVQEADNWLKPYGIQKEYLLSLKPGQFYFVGKANPSPIPLLISFKPES